MRAIIRALTPAQPTRAPRRAAGTLRRRGLRGGFEGRHDGHVGVGREQRGGCHPAREVGFETVHVGGAREFRLAGYFVGNVGGEEGVQCGGDEAVQAGFPDFAAVGLWTYQLCGLLRMDEE